MGTCSLSSHLPSLISAQYSCLQSLLSEASAHANMTASGMGGLRASVSLHLPLSASICVGFLPRKVLSLWPSVAALASNFHLHVEQTDSVLRVPAQPLSLPGLAFINLNV